MYCFDSRVRYSEVDYNGNMKFDTLIDYFQDCSSFQSEELEIGLEYLEKEKAAWVLISWQIEVERYPVFGERIQVGTWAYDFKSFYGSRNFLMTDEAGNRLAYANSLWALMDLESGHPCRPKPEMIAAYQMEPALPMQCESRKMKIPEHMVLQESFPVHKFHLDTNHHVNNGKYILMAQEYLPEQFKIGKMRAEYKKSAVYGDTIYPAVAKEGEKITVVLGDEAQKPYAIVELEEKHDKIR